MLNVYRYEVVTKKTIQTGPLILTHNDAFTINYITSQYKYLMLYFHIILLYFRKAMDDFLIVLYKQILMVIIFCCLVHLYVAIVGLTSDIKECM